jgi:hypothetical protein
MEAIVASGFESRAPPPGEHSFTNALVDVLEDWINRRSFSASCLHSEILTQLKLKEKKKGREGQKLEWCVTSIYINCTQDSRTPSIELCRRNILPPPKPNSHPADASPLADTVDLDIGTSHSRSMLFSLNPSALYRNPQVIISVALEESQPDLDVKTTARWLESIPFLAKWVKVDLYRTPRVLISVTLRERRPDLVGCEIIASWFEGNPHLAKWAKVEGLFRSYSTLLLLSVPVPV